MTGTPLSKTAALAFGVLLASFLAACGASDGSAPADDETPAAQSPTASEQPEPTAEVPSPTAGPTETPVAARSDTTSAGNPTAAAVFEPQPDFSTVDELISTAESRRSNSDLPCLGGDDSRNAREIEVLGRCLELQYQVPRDGIPAIFDPKFTTPEFVEIPDSELVIGLSIEGDHRAYSVPFLSNHEVVNDVVGGKPVAVTW